MSNKTKTFSLSLDSVAILEAALRDHNDMLDRTHYLAHGKRAPAARIGLVAKAYDFMADVEELRSMFAAVLKAEG
tara:strand:+ start:764 stop:988 length:225 start_codon:yes stop_codon:yes gene_type:complete